MRTRNRVRVILLSVAGLLLLLVMAILLLAIAHKVPGDSETETVTGGARPMPPLPPTALDRSMPGSKNITGQDRAVEKTDELGFKRDANGPADVPEGHTVEMVTPELAKQVAAQFAEARWEGSRVGEGFLAYAPDGRPEVYFFLVFKQGVPELSLQDLSKKVSDLRKRRLEIEQAPIEDTSGNMASQQEEMRAIWHQMRAADKYGTVVVGANEGREPFIASFGGLPPQVFLLEDAMQVAAAALHTDQQMEPRVIWCPPLFIFFKFAGGPADRTLFLQAQGSNLCEALLSGWKRPVMPQEVLQRRKARWAAEKEIGDG